MAKDTFYFSHDYNSRTDEKIKRLIRKCGMEGYGIFWSIIEDLYNNANALQTDYNNIAYDLRVSEDLVKTIVTELDLFVIDGDFFGSLSVERRLNERNEKSKKASESAKYRWQKQKENAIALDNDANAAKIDAIKERKGKETKGKEIIYPYQDIVDAWNEIVSSCPEVKKLTDARKEKIRIRLHEISDQPETWLECVKTLFKMIQDSDFLSGRKTSWVASFDWFFVNSKNWIKIAEGNYENRTPSNETKKGVSNQEMRDILQRRATEIFSQQQTETLELN